MDILKTMLNEQEQERLIRLWPDAQPAVESYVHAPVRNPFSAKTCVTCHMPGSSHTNKKLIKK